MAKAIFNWSTGKDSALALYKVLESKQFDELHLLTSTNKELERVTMHGLRISLLERQLDALGLSNSKLELPLNPDMDTYDSLMKETLGSLKNQGYSHSIFGDIFLEDLKKYRENKLQEIELQGLFPLWKRDTKELIQEFLELGFQSIVVCVNGEKLDKSFCGRIIDESFLADLPEDIDPCGENGEFHTFCFDGPIFKHKIQFDIGETVTKSYPKPNSDNEKVDYYFLDLL